MTEPRITRWLLLKPGEGGNPLSWVSPTDLVQLLDDPKGWAGVEQFVNPNDIDRDPNYWPDGIGILLRVEVVIPVSAGAYRLPEDLDV